MISRSLPRAERAAKKIVIGSAQGAPARQVEDILRSHGFLIAATACDFGALQDAIREHRPAVTLFEETVLPSLDAVSELLRAEPHCVFVLRAREVSPEFRNRAAFLGVRAILPPGMPPEQLGQVLGILTSFPAAGRPAIDVLQTCDSTERKLVALIAQGMELQEASAILKFPEPAVRDILNGVLRRLGIRDRYELTLHVLASKSMPAGSFGENTSWKNETAIVSH